MPVADLATLGVPVVADIGSGLLAPDPLLPDEPDAATTLRAGAALVTASGDKLLGGPQAGLLLGDADLVERLRRHPLARALRVDKLTLAALEATLRGPQPPTWHALHAEPAALRERAEQVCVTLGADGCKAEVVPVGGGRRRRRRARRRAGLVGGVACRAVRRAAAHAAIRRCSAGSSAAGCCSTCAACPPTLDVCWCRRSARC